MNIAQIPKNLGIGLACAIFAGCTYASQGFPDDDRGALPTESADIYGDVAKRIVYPVQNWDSADSLWFYYTSQGSNLMDYQIFKHLEQVDSPVEGKIKLFRDYDNMNRFRFLMQRNTPGNEDWLPVGWAKDTYEGQDYIGFTCAACHTTQVNYNNEQKGISVGIRIDGGPSMADIQTMFTELEHALQDSVYNEKNPGKFNRLAEAVLMPDATESDKLGFRDQLTKQYMRIKNFNAKDNPKNGMIDPPHRQKNGGYGYGRLDAFGRIFNRIESVRSPVKGEGYHPANAPVSYPFLWDTPHHDFVQWNGIAGNTGVGGLGPLGRNASEVLGVFATVHAGNSEPWLITTLLGFGNYSSSLRKWNQVGLERKIKHLWSPSWEQLAKDNILPEIKGLPKSQETRTAFIEKIEMTDEKELEQLMPSLSDWELGLAVFKKYKCVLCHQPIDRKDSGRRVISQFASVGEIRTDATMANNAIFYCSQNEFPDVPKEQRCQTSIDQEDTPTGAKGADVITHLTGEVLSNGALWDIPVYAVSWGSNPWKSWIPFMTSEADRHVDFEVVNKNDADKDPKVTHLNVYKGRPLNGIWATAPYLHNGSVSNLYELFLPSSCEDKNGRKLEPGTTCRSKTFTVGSRELDTEKVGFKQLDNLKGTYPELVFDTELLGNSNKGHEYAAGVTRIIKTDAQGHAIRKSDGQFDVEYLMPINHDERMALLEYLKSL
jgi:hypothetical protein